MDSTRDRLVDEAMRLFSAQGYRATSVAQIEQAAGLSPGAGGLYHHFRSKEALLAAGIQRQLDRLQALRDIRQIFDGLGDLRSELTVCARFTLQLLDEEAPLLRVAVSELGARPAVLGEAFAAMLSSTYGEFSAWLGGKLSGVAPEQVAALASVALASLFGLRAASHVLDAPGAPVDDGAFVAEWVETVATRAEALLEAR